MDALMGSVEELLLATTAQRQGMDEHDQQDAPCPAIVRLLIHGQEEYAKVLVGGGVHTREHARAAFDSIQWIADRRKTKADTEERALQKSSCGFLGA